MLPTSQGITTAGSSHSGLAGVFMQDTLPDSVPKGFVSHPSICENQLPKGTKTVFSVDDIKCLCLFSWTELKIIFMHCTLSVFLAFNREGSISLSLKHYSTKINCWCRCGQTWWGLGLSKSNALALSHPVTLLSIPGMKTMSLLSLSCRPQLPNIKQRTMVRSSHCHVQARWVSLQKTHLYIW